MSDKLKMNQEISQLQVDKIKEYIARINELDTLSTNSYMPIDKMSSSQRQHLFKQFNKYLPTIIKPQKI